MKLTVVATIWALLSLGCDDRERRSEVQPQQSEPPPAVYEGPSLEEMRSVIGLSSDAPAFLEFVSAFGFRPQKKGQPVSGPDSWGSSFGAMIRASGGKIWSVGVRVPSENTNGNYTGPLPSGLRRGDTIEQVQMKLGDPVRGKYGADERVYFDELMIDFHGTALSEVWLLNAANR